MHSDTCSRTFRIVIFVPSQETGDFLSTHGEQLVKTKGGKNCSCEWEQQVGDLALTKCKAV
jgi:hypothetical protein